MSEGLTKEGMRISKVPKYRSLKTTYIRDPCPIASCLGFIDFIGQHYDPIEGLNYTTYGHSACGYWKTEIREGAPGFVATFNKPIPKDKRNKNRR